MKLRKGDQVVVIAGKDKGKRGAVLAIFPARQRVLVEGVNQVKRHTKPTQQQPQGGIVTKSMPLHVSNIMLADPKTGAPTRIGRTRVAGKKDEPARWARVARKSGEVLPDTRPARA